MITTFDSVLISEKTARVPNVELSKRLSMKLSVISPTLNEVQNVSALAEEVDRALLGIDYELLFVDDASVDGTAERVKTLGRMNPRIRLLQRRESPGLSASVIDGFACAHGELIACIDADLQHDPTIIPIMMALMPECDVVVGSRYTEGARIESWNRLRRVESTTASGCARVILRIKLRDPMSGFFMMRRSHFLFIRPKLNGQGFKILLEILAALRPTKVKVCEVPYTFRPRVAGQSKLSTKVMVAYMQQLWRLSSVGSPVKIEVC